MDDAIWRPFCICSCKHNNCDMPSFPVLVPCQAFRFLKGKLRTDFSEGLGHSAQTELPLPSELPLRRSTSPGSCSSRLIRRERWDSSKASLACSYNASKLGGFIGSWLRSYKWGYTSPNMGYNYGYPYYNPTYNCATRRRALKRCGELTCSLSSCQDFFFQLSSIAFVASRG